MGQRDKTMRNLISHPDVFADIINVLVFDGNKYLVGDRLCHLSSENSAPLESGELKELIRDVCMVDMKDGTSYLVLGIENQEGVDETMPLRVIGWFKMYQRYAEATGAI